MKLKPTHLAALALSLGIAVHSNAAMLLTPAITEVRYNFDSGNITTDLTTDVSGNGRTMSTIYGTGSLGWGGSGIGPTTNPGALNVNSGMPSWIMTNTVGMATDDFQVSIYAASYTSDKSPMTIFAAGNSFRLGITGNGSGNLGSFYAEVDGVTIGTSAVGGNYWGQGLMIQRSGGVYSFWVDTAVNGSWTQVGSDFSSAVAPDWASSHFFVKPGGGENFDGGVDNFVVASVPEPGAALLGGLGMLALLRRRR